VGGGAAEEKDSYKKRVAELENDIQLSRMERASFIEQINKQFKEEEKLLATVQTMKNEFEELRSTYTQTVSKLQDSRYASPSPKPVPALSRRAGLVAGLMARSRVSAAATASCACACAVVLCGDVR
jgi:septal ring factor EnvC (AmiA/AmiB activator)